MFIFINLFIIYLGHITFNLIECGKKLETKLYLDTVFMKFLTAGTQAAQTLL